ncbi:hypothetical protein ABZ896_27455 [Streptomyces sp. NPDC047072]|uniref:hypothetical protein n=1 Tax=Streptomyces sp. NPDC047072 TaxID=3154809 RepID=UPI00340AF555
MTAASFGVPLALMLLNRVAMVQAGVVEARTGRHPATRVAGDSAAPVPRLVTGPGARLEGGSAALPAMERTAQAALKGWKPNRDDGALAAVRRQLTDGTLEHAQEEFRAAVRPGGAVVSVVGEGAAHWSFLDTTVRGRLLETSGAWLSARLAARIDAYVSRLTADPCLDGRLRDLDIAQRRFADGGHISAAPREL